MRKCIQISCNCHWTMMTVAISLWFISVQFAAAQVREAWITTVEDIRGFAFASTLDNQNHLLVTGSLNNGYATIKYDGPTGQERWVARHSGAPDSAQAVITDTNGDVFVTGSSVRSATRADYWTVKYDGQTGQLLWSVKYNGPGNSDDAAYAVALDETGDVYVTGGSTGAGTGLDYTTLKYNGQTGQQLWVARYNGPGNGSDVARAVTLDSEGNLFITGSSTGSGTNRDYATIKYNGRTGGQLWVARYNGTANGLDQAQAIAADSSGNVYVTGGSDASGGRFYTTIKYDGRSGERLWLTFSSAYTGDNARAIVVDSNGNVFVTGSSNYSVDCLTEKYSGQTGQILWSQPLRGACGALKLDEVGNVYVTGNSFSFFPSPVGDFRTVKYDGRTGRLLWQMTYPIANAQSITVDDEGGVYVTGFEGPDLQERYLSIKYEQAPPGDVNLDFCVDDIDLLRILDTFGQSGDLPEDVNRDGVVDDQDLLTVLFNFGRGCG